MVAGVAGGIAEYFQVDPVLVRLAFVVLALAGGGGVLVYLIAWVIVPEAEQGEASATPRGGGMDAETGRLLIGGALIAIGGIILAARFIPYFHVVFWPLVLIGAGIAVIAGARK